jgi:hypothetical protein
MFGAQRVALPLFHGEHQVVIAEVDDLDGARPMPAQVKPRLFCCNDG